MEFAIVDIETTGGNASESGITEIAVFVHDGQKVTHEWQTLINPCLPIPYYIQSLTGINDQMVANSPTFSEVAQTIYQLLKDRVFVAHNVNFDYSFIKHHLLAAGIVYNAQKLCTVRMSRKIKPGLPSYSLGKLCHSLDIPIDNRHRAAGDAAATSILFTRLLNWDTEAHIQQMLKKGSKEALLPPNLSKKEIEKLPSSPGIYYFLDKHHKIIYVGKAVDIRKRVNSHFTGHNTTQQRQSFLRNIYHIQFKETGTELMALLMEATEIKRIWPKHNLALKRFEASYGLFCYEDQNGYKRLAINKLANNQSSICSFNRLIDGKNQLMALSKEFHLCQQFCFLGPCDPQICSENCMAKMQPEIYNELVMKAISKLTIELPSFVIFDKGRTSAEKTAILVEKGNFTAMGFLPNITSISGKLSFVLEPFIKNIKKYPANYYMTQLVMNYSKHNPSKVIPVEDTRIFESIIPAEKLAVQQSLFPA